MNYWLLADTHFGHRNMQRLCGRPIDFERKIMESLLRYIKSGDLLIHLGDFCFGDDQLWHQKFMALCDSYSCRRWLIKGDHDEKSYAWYLEHGWDCVAEQLVLQVFGKKIVFSHEPVSEQSYFDLNIHGHFHNNQNPLEATLERYRLVHMEHHYAPVSLKKIVSG